MSKSANEPVTPAGESSTSGGLIGLAVDRPVATLMLIAAVAVFGYVSLKKLPTTLLPKISYPSLTIRTEYPGSAPAEVEELITKPLEENVSVISNLSSFRSISRAGVSDIILEFEWDTNMSFAAQDVREKVDTVRAQLPQDVKKPLLLKYDPTLDPIMRIGLYGGDLARMRYFAEEKLKKSLESTPGVAAVRVKGGFETEIRVDLSDSALEQYRISHSTIAQRLSEENVNLASGLLRSGDVEYLVRTLNEFRSIEEIRDLVIAAVDGRLIRLRDVATVRESTREPDVVTRINGQPSVEIGIFKEDSANIIDVAHVVKTTLFGTSYETTLKGGEVDRLRYEAARTATKSPGMGGRPGPSSQLGGGPLPIALSLPEQMTVRLLSDQSRFIRQSIAEVQDSGWQGAVLAVVILLLFLRKVSATAIIAFSIPTSVIATFGPMYKWDVSLNIMSLGGLAMGIGMVVDASIVVLEAIDRYRDEGLELRDAAILGTREVAGAVFASVLTTVAVFLPIVFVQGIAGEIFKDQSLTVVFSQIASLLIALFGIPMLSARVGRRKGAAPLRPREFLHHWLLCARDHSPLTIRKWSSLRSVRGEGIRASSRPIRALQWGFMVLIFPLFFVLEFTCRSLFALVVLLSTLAGLLIGVVFLLVKWLMWPFAWIFDRVYDFGVQVFSLVLRGALASRLLVILGVLFLTWYAWTLLPKIGLELIPEVHSGEIIVEIPQKVGTSLTASADIARRAEEIIDREKAAGRLPLLGHSTVIGVARDEIAPAGEGSHTAKLHLVLEPALDMAAREDAAKDVIRNALAAIPEIGPPAFSAPRLFSFQNPLEVQIKGENLDRIGTVADRLLDRVRNDPLLKDVRTTLQEGSPEYVIEYNRVELAKRGLTLGQAAATLRDKIKGTVPTKYSVAEDNKRIDILMRIPESNITSLEELRNVRIGGGSNGSPSVKLFEVAEIIPARGPSEIRHIRGERAILLTATPAAGDLKTAAARVNASAEDERKLDAGLFEGVLVSVGGQTAEAERSMRELLFALMIALALVYIVMASQFESLLDPLVIMVTSIFAGVGVIFTLYFLALPAGIVVFIGCILLAGIVVNNAIVLVDCANRLVREGKNRRTAIYEASRIRLRPILMTTLTTILGLIPMAFTPGEGSEMRAPMAITVIAGMTSGTVLTLIIIPVIYLTAHQALDTLKGLLRRTPST